MTTIYGLYDDFGNIRYVGKTRNRLEFRLREHLCRAKKVVGSVRAGYCQRWIQSLLFKGSVPSIKLICTVSGDGNYAEKFYISHFRNLGAKLTNLTNGGDGGSTSELTKERWITRRANGNANIKMPPGTGKKVWESRKRNGTDSDSIRKRTEKRRADGWKENTRESALRGWITRRKNNNVKAAIPRIYKYSEERRKNLSLHWTPRDPWNKGIKMPESFKIRMSAHNGCAKLNSEKVLAIRNDNSGLSQREIGLKYGVCHSTISEIKSRKTWKYV